MFADFDYAVILENRGLLLEGMGVTLILTVMALSGGLVLGVLLALCRLSRARLLSAAAAGYVNFFRSMPLILIIFWFYFMAPLLVGRPVGGFYSVLIAFTLFEAAYYCEIVRAGIQSVRRGQVSAGMAIGLTPVQTMRYVVLPQAVRNMIPVLLTQAIILFQDTSLVYVVGVKDFLVSAELIAVRENRVLETLTTVALTYFLICLAGSLAVKRLQKVTSR